MKRILGFLTIVIISFTATVMAAPIDPNAPIKKSMDVKCYPQRVVTNYMKQKKFKIMFNWMAKDGKVIKILAANKKANVMLVHIIDSETACVLDEFGENTQAPSLFFELFNFGSDSKL